MQVNEQPSTLKHPVRVSCILLILVHSTQHALSTEIIGDPRAMTVYRKQVGVLRTQGRVVNAGEIAVMWCCLWCINHLRCLETPHSMQVLCVTGIVRVWNLKLGVMRVYYPLWD